MSTKSMRISKPKRESRLKVKRGLKGLIDLTGQRFGRWVVLSRSENNKNGHPRWIVRCNCGASHVVRSELLRNGRSKSCGCLRDELAREASTKHGHAINDQRTREYNSWAMMRNRCESKNSTSWKNYGHKGVTVTDRWKGESGFQHFLLDMGPRPEGKSLDRLDVEGNYEKSNCRWSTPLEQVQPYWNGKKHHRGSIRFLKKREAEEKRQGVLFPMEVKASS